MKVNSVCCVCGKREKVEESIVSRDSHGNYHTCDKCLNGDGHEWGANRITKKEIRQKKKYGI